MIPRAGARETSTLAELFVRSACAYGDDAIQACGISVCPLLHRARRVIAITFRRRHRFRQGRLGEQADPFVQGCRATIILPALAFGIVARPPKSLSCPRPDKDGSNGKG
jgi:hypothetical protein